MSIKKNFIKIVRKFPCLYRSLKRIYGMLLHFKLSVKRIKKHGSFTHMYSVKEIIMQQNRKEGYNRLDIVVRLLAIENEYGLNNCGWELYRKMQERRVGKEVMSISDRIIKFKSLIRSWEINGYDDRSLIFLDNNLMLKDGSHRLALAIYHGLDKINCKVLSTNENIAYGVNWFIENNFTEQEIKLILNRADRVIGANRITISCILWPPVKEYFDEIVNKLALAHNVLETRDVSFSNETFERFVQAVYQIDDIEQWKIEKKMKYMAGASEKVVRLVILEFDTPKFRYKDLNYNSILVQGEQIKKMIRNCYKEKIDNYFYDIICHTGDNQEQSEYIMKLFTPCFSPYEYFEKIGGGG